LYRVYISELFALNANWNKSLFVLFIWIPNKKAATGLFKPVCGIENRPQVVTSFQSVHVKVLTPRSDAKELEMRGNRAYLIGNFLKLHKKPPVGKQRGRFFRIFAASG
jgi:hypothetical protein